MNDAELIIPNFDKPLEFHYDKSSLKKFMKPVAVFVSLFLVSFGMLVHAAFFSDDPYGESYGTALIGSLVFGGILIYQILNMHHLKDQFLFTNEFARVSNPNTKEIIIHWDKVECITLSKMQDEIHILGDSKKILIDESLPGFELFLQIFGIKKAEQGGPIKRSAQTH